MNHLVAAAAFGERPVSRSNVERMSGSVHEPKSTTRADRDKAAAEIGDLLFAVDVGEHGQDETGVFNQGCLGDFKRNVCRL